MADIELVVKIPEHCLEGLRHIELNESNEGIVFHAIKCIVNGTPLPKGHGDLKDANKLKHTFISWSMVVQGNFTDADIASIVCNSPTIIEADRKEQE